MQLVMGLRLPLAFPNKLGKDLNQTETIKTKRGGGVLGVPEVEGLCGKYIREALGLLPSTKEKLLNLHFNSCAHLLPTAS